MRNLDHSVIQTPVPCVSLEQDQPATAHNGNKGRE
jgi:hypothetical protein